MNTAPEVIICADLAELGPLLLAGELGTASARALQILRSRLHAFLGARYQRGRFRLGLAPRDARPLSLCLHERASVLVPGSETPDLLREAVAELLERGAGGTRLTFTVDRDTCNAILTRVSNALFLLAQVDDGIPF